MSGRDRAARAVARHLDPDELLVASADGLEGDGRRRQQVLLTDRRILLIGRRATPPEQLPIAGANCSYQPVGGQLTLRNATKDLLVRDVDPVAARTLVREISARSARAAAPQPASRASVQIITKGHGDGSDSTGTPADTPATGR